jgi:hypothetical protein
LCALEIPSSPATENRGRQRYLERSQEREVARDAFLRRIRGKDFNPISYLDPLTSDRGAALARIMQADKDALEALLSEPVRPKEFVIELTGDYDIIRVMKG